MEDISQLAAQQFLSGEFASAADSYEKLVASNPSDKFSKSRLVECLISSNNAKKGLDICESLVEDSLDSLPLYERCVKAACGDTATSVLASKIDSLIEWSLPEGCSLESSYFIGSHFVNRLIAATYSAEEEDEARWISIVNASMDRIDELVVNAPKGFLLKGKYFLYLHQESDAIILVNRYVSACPTDAQGYQLLAECFEVQRNYAEAMKWHLVSDIHRQEGEKLTGFQNALNMSVKNNKPDWVLDLFGKRIEMDPPRSSAVYKLTTVALVKLGKPQAAVMICSNWVSDNPSDNEGWQVLGELSFKAKSFDVAENAYRNLCRLTEETNPAFLNMLAAILLARINLDESFKFCVKAILKKPDYQIAWRNLSELRKLSTAAGEVAETINEKFLQFYREFGETNSANPAVEEYIQRITKDHSNDVLIIKQAIKQI